MAAERLMREYRSFISNPCIIGSVEPTDNLLVWKAYLNGPEDSPYEGGVFKLKLKFPGVYPMKPPEVVFKTKIFHANIQNDGKICLSLFSDWRPTDNVLTVLLALNNMLAQPNRDSAYVGDDLSERDYNKQAKQWTKDYARN
ncbi:unnamed protein product [Oppiella nova]|uniref:UBC core domain-containing protein n=1 Tax=Oppiella nova TaxID=334625 RepID=A0A7R9LWD8_9ACAR|nr:unnamed protein product [Oppiella nova]CAG2167572.1 unnamed protein product [Oppiella nova]